MAKLGPFPSFSLSASALDKVGECLHRHYLATYQSWGGWDKNLSPKDPRRLAYILKHLRSFDAVIGSLMHEIGAAAAKRGPVTGAMIYRWADRAVERLDQYVSDAREGAYMVDPKKKPGLDELHYGCEDFEARHERARDKARACVRDLLTNGHLHRVQRGEARLLAAESLEAVRLPVTFEGDGCRVTLPGEPQPDAVGAHVDVYAVPDLAYEVDHADGGTAVVITDWKSGKHDKFRVRRQLGLYLATSKHVRRYVLDGRWDRIHLVGVYTSEHRERTSRASPELVDEARTALQDAVLAIRERVVDGDLSRNQPHVGETAWPKLDVGSKACRYCEFRGPCGRAA
jgi:hypothetical protein